MNPDTRLLHLPLSSRYAVSAALFLASLPDGKYHMVGKIAQRTGLSPSYLAKILQRLAQHGLLDSRRGVKGGYRLSRPSAEFSLAEIVSASQRLETGGMPCMIEARDCDCAMPCSMHEYVASAEAALWRGLKETTLSNLGRSPSIKGEKK